MLVDHAPVANYIHHIHLFHTLHPSCRDGMIMNHWITHHYMSCANTTSVFPHHSQPSQSFRWKESKTTFSRAWWIWVHHRHLGQRSGYGFAAPSRVGRRCPPRLRCFGSPCRYRLMFRGSGQNPKLCCPGRGSNLRRQTKTPWFQKVSLQNQAKSFKEAEGKASGPALNLWKAQPMSTMAKIRRQPKTSTTLPQALGNHKVFEAQQTMEAWWGLFQDLPWPVVREERGRNPFPILWDPWKSTDLRSPGICELQAAAFWNLETEERVKNTLGQVRKPCARSKLKNMGKDSSFPLCLANASTNPAKIRKTRRLCNKLTLFLHNKTLVQYSSAAHRFLFFALWSSECSHYSLAFPFRPSCSKTAGGHFPILLRSLWSRLLFLKPGLHLRKHTSKDSLFCAHPSFHAATHMCARTRPPAHRPHARTHAHVWHIRWAELWSIKSAGHRGTLRTSDACCVVELVGWKLPLHVCPRLRKFSYHILWIICSISYLSCAKDHGTLYYMSKIDWQLLDAIRYGSMWYDVIWSLTDIVLAVYSDGCF